MACIYVIYRVEVHSSNTRSLVETVEKWCRDSTVDDGCSVEVIGGRGHVRSRGLVTGQPDPASPPYSISEHVLTCVLHAGDVWWLLKVIQGHWDDIIRTCPFSLDVKWPSHWFLSFGRWLSCPSCWCHVMLTSQRAGAKPRCCVVYSVGQRDAVVGC